MTPTLCQHLPDSPCDDMTPRFPAGAAQSESVGTYGCKATSSHGSPLDHARARPAHGRSGVSGILRPCLGGAVDLDLGDGQHYHIAGPILALLSAEDVAGDHALEVRLTLDARRRKRAA